MNEDATVTRTDDGDEVTTHDGSIVVAPGLWGGRPHVECGSGRTMSALTVIDGDSAATVTLTPAQRDALVELLRRMG